MVQDRKRDCPQKSEVEISYPKRKSEAEIQAMLWIKLVVNKLDARIEVSHTIRNPNGGKYVRQISRFDIVVFVDKVAKIIIEVKARKINERKIEEQRMKYECYKPELIYCFGEDEIPKTLEYVCGKLIPTKV